MGHNSYLERVNDLMQKFCLYDATMTKANCGVHCYGCVFEGQDGHCLRSALTF